MNLPKESKIFFYNYIFCGRLTKENLVSLWQRAARRRGHGHIKILRRRTSCLFRFPQLATAQKALTNLTQSVKRLMHPEGSSRYAFYELRN